MSNKTKNDQSDHNGGRKGGGANPSASAGSAAAASPQSTIEKLSHDVQQLATDDDLTKAVEHEDTSLVNAPLSKIAEEGLEVLKTLKSIKSRLDGEMKSREARQQEQRLKLTKDEQDLRAQEVNLKTQREAVERDRQSLHNKEAALTTREAAVTGRDEAVTTREVEAEAGFAKQRRESVKTLAKEAQVLRDEMSTHQERLAAGTAASLKQVDARLASADKEVEERVAARERSLEQLRLTLETKHDELARTKLELAGKANRLEVDRQLLEEARRGVKEAAEVLAASEVERLTALNKALGDRLGAARQSRDELAALLRKREEADKRFGERTPEQVCAELDKLRKDAEQLRSDLAGRLNANATQRLRELEQQSDQWEAERATLMQANAELKHKAALNQIAVTELETLRDQKMALQSSRALMEAALNELRKDVDERIRSSDGKCPFPSCAEMDQNAEFQTPQILTQDIKDLQQFAADLQCRMGYNPDTKKELFYSGRDIRSLLGGLAMSRLHLLEGISGTGKTSLPLAFARAVGAGTELIEVQAGWRDRQDLLGHFNSFERRYYESEFLQALYLAQCPRYQHAIFVVVLDEMNLSHPEQYFADLLSQLEQDEDRREIDLMTAAVAPAPRLFKRGRTLRIPSNVWFVGTANHDETTKEFADKTYDRAHVMELPRHFERFDLDPRAASRAQLPLACGALIEAFGKAQKQRAKDADQAYAFLDKSFFELLGKRFGIGCSNRLTGQTARFVPVVIAAGGKAGEAVDHLLSTKLLRKLRNRHDNRPDALHELNTRLTTEFAKFDTSWWSDVEAGRAILQSREVVRGELARLGVDED